MLLLFRYLNSFMPRVFKITNKLFCSFGHLVHLKKVPAMALTGHFTLKESLVILWARLFVPDYFRKGRKFCALRQMTWHAEMKQQRKGNFKEQKHSSHFLSYEILPMLKYNFCACVYKQNYNYALSMNHSFQLQPLNSQVFKAYEDNKSFQAIPSNRRLIWGIQDLPEVLFSYYYLPSLKKRML